MVALSVTVHKALILLVFLNHPYQSLALQGFSGVLLNALKLQIVANQSKIEHVATTC